MERKHPLNVPLCVWFGPQCPDGRWLHTFSGLFEESIPPLTEALQKLGAPLQCRVTFQPVVPATFLLIKLEIKRSRSALRKQSLQLQNNRNRPVETNQTECRISSKNVLLVAEWEPMCTNIYGFTCSCSQSRVPGKRCWRARWQGGERRASPPSGQTGSQDRWNGFSLVGTDL